MLTVNGTCGCDKCVSRTKEMYHMVGYCINCGTKEILMVFRAGDPKRDLDCPVCFNWRSVRSQRLANENEIPESEEDHENKIGKKYGIRP